MEKKNLDITNMNGVSNDDDTTCGLNDMNCLGNTAEDDSTCSITKREKSRNGWSKRESGGLRIIRLPIMALTVPTVRNSWSCCRRSLP